MKSETNAQALSLDKEAPNATPRKGKTNKSQQE